MIIDPQTFMALEMDRHLAAARAVQDFREHSGAPRRRPPRRGLLLRLVVWATGRTAHA